MRLEHDLEVPERQAYAPRDWNGFARPSLLVREILFDNRRYELNMEQAKVLFDVGRFRVVQSADLRRLFSRSEDKKLAEKTIRSLIKLGLLSKKRMSSPQDGSRLEVLTVTTKGRKLLDHAMQGTGQRFYEKLVKKREIVHDTAIYRVFQIEAERIWKNGGYINRVVLDHELKAGIFSAVEKSKHQGIKVTSDLQAKIAEEFQLAVIDGKLPLPDLRIEYRFTGEAPSHIDLEISTGHYKKGQVATKARAGFSIYRLASRPGGVPRGEDLLREVFSR